GAPFPRKDERVLSVGWSALSDVLLERSGRSGEDMGASYQRHADLGDVAHDLIADSARDGDPLTLADVAAAFDGIAKAFDRERDAVARANMLTGDIGEAALRAKHGTLDEPTLAHFRPIGM